MKRRVADTHAGRNKDLFTGTPESSAASNLSMISGLGVPVQAQGFSSLGLADVDGSLFLLYFLLVICLNALGFFCLCFEDGACQKIMEHTERLPYIDAEYPELTKDGPIAMVEFSASTIGSFSI